MPTLNHLLPALMQEMIGLPTSTVVPLKSVFNIATTATLLKWKKGHIISLLEALGGLQIAKSKTSLWILAGPVPYLPSPVPFSPCSDLYSYPPHIVHALCLLLFLEHNRHTPMEDLSTCYFCCKYIYPHGFFMNQSNFSFPMWSFRNPL